MTDTLEGERGRVAPLSDEGEGIGKRTMEDAPGEGVGTQQAHKWKQGKAAWYGLPEETLL